jgi:uncharacterized membrane protein HdeD (DUF308 family)
MKRVPRVVLTALGAVLVLVGVAMAITSDAELWWAPVVVGGCIVVLGVLFIVAARSPSRLSR